MRNLLPIFAISFLALPLTTGAQSLLERSPNVSGGWTGSPGTIHFNFAHRFTLGPAPERKVTNIPTLFVGAGLPKRLLAGLNYSSNSALASRKPNEWELFGRWMPLSEDVGSPVDVAAQAGYNNAAEGIDAELSAAKRFGVIRVMVAGRSLADPFDTGNRRLAAAGAATVRFGQYVALAGDIGALADRDTTERVAWGIGLHLAIPLTPHTVSLHATNAMITTLQGASRGSSSVRYGFEFTIPFTLRRYFGKRVSVAERADSVDRSMPDVAVAHHDSVPQRVDPVTVAPPAAPVMLPAPAVPQTGPESSPPAKQSPIVVRTRIRNSAYAQPRLRIAVGTTVEWTNSDPMPHSVTAVNGAFNSGLIAPGKTYRRTFTRAGTYDFTCIPHPFMKGVIIVTAP